MKTKFFSENFMPYFIGCIHAKFQKLMRTFAKDAQSTCAANKVHGNINSNLDTKLGKKIFSIRRYMFTPYIKKI